MMMLYFLEIEILNL